MPPVCLVLRLSNPLDTKISRPCGREIFVAVRRLRRLRRLFFGVRFTVASVAIVASCRHFIRLDYHRDVRQADAATFVFCLELVLHLILIQ